jgi:hypothetical protein
MGNYPLPHIVLDFLLQLRSQHRLIIEDLMTPLLPNVPHRVKDLSVQQLGFALSWSSLPTKFLVTCNLSPGEGVAASRSSV